MQAGALKHRVQILRIQKDTTGLFVKTEYVPLKTVWAKVNGLYGSEKWTATEYDAKNTAEFTIRHAACPDLTVQDRLHFRGRLYNIIHIDNVLFQNHFLKITATAEEEGAEDDGGIG